MHDLRWIRENPEEFDRGLARRGLAPRAAEVLALDKEWRALQTEAEEAQARAQSNWRARSAPQRSAAMSTTDPSARRVASKDR